MFNKIDIIFSDFKVRELSASDRRSAKSGNNPAGIISVSPEIAFGYVEKKRAPFYISLVVKLSLMLEHEESPGSEDVELFAMVEGEATFELKGMGAKKFNEIFHNLEFLDTLADRAYPVAASRLKNLLSEMEFQTDFPLSLPPVSSRHKIDHSTGEVAEMK